MKIGELAQRTACQVETIRYYERIGMLAPPVRSANNYRTYGDAHVERLLFIRHCRALDMTLDEVRVLLNFRDRPGDVCDGVNELLDKHIGHVTSRIESLRVLEQQLRQLRSECSPADCSTECGILHALAAPAPLEAGAPGHLGGAGC
ncbi:Cd(II)/Pb(II)-responsive transcriptional regulator [Massilia cavernae]|uniref:Cd(II)/Pb(II)-responsive transcriptional regulator n=1 Tax=Massilia cavernae TaxID=2320864 RepID=A0A418XE12_9BURK|nr:Cd(II)/Pb(II)-responsive transcriptional regulator [Massilia cavernae]